MRWNLLVDELAEDLRNGFRQIARNPGFTAIVVADARARHRREHGPVLDLQQPDPAPAARARSRQSCAAHRRLMVLSDLERDHDTRDRVVRRHVGLVRPEVRLVGRRSDRTGRWRVRQRPALRRARRHRYPRPDALACRRQRRPDGRPGRCHQPSSLAAAFRRRPRRRRAPAHGAAHSVHHRGRDAAGILRSRRRPDDGRDVALRGRAAHSRSGEPVGREELVVAADHGAAEARTEPRAGERRAPGRPGPNHGGRITPTQAVHPRGGHDRQLVAAQPLRIAAPRDGRRRGARAARRVRQHRQSHARADAGAPPRVQRAAGARKLPRAHRTAAFHRESDRGRHRCGGRVGVRVVEQCAPRAAVEHMAEHGVAGPRARLACARLHRGSCVSLRAHRFRGACARAEDIGPWRGAQRLGSWDRG